MLGPESRFGALPASAHTVQVLVPWYLGAGLEPIVDTLSISNSRPPSVAPRGWAGCRCRVRSAIGPAAVLRSCPSPAAGSGRQREFAESPGSRLKKREPRPPAAARGCLAATPAAATPTPRHAAPTRQAANGLQHRRSPKAPGRPSDRTALRRCAWRWRSTGGAPGPAEAALLPASGPRCPAPERA